MLVGDRLSQEGRDENENPKIRINSQVNQSNALHPLNGVKGLSLEFQPSITSGTGHPGLAADKGRRWEKPPPHRGIMLNPRGECRTKALGETGEMNRHQEQPGVKPEGIIWASFAKSFFTRPYYLKHVSLGSLSYGGYLL